MGAYLRYPVLGLFTALLCAAGATNGLRFILAPMNANSPALDLMAVGAKLIERGHEVAVVVSGLSVDHMKRAAARHSSNTTAEAFRYIPVDLGLPAVEGATKNLTQMRLGMMNNFAAPTTFWQSLMVGPRMLYLMRNFVAKPCQHILTDPKTLQSLKDFAADAVMSVSLPVTAAGLSDNCGCLMAHSLHTSFIDVAWGPQSSVDYWVPQYASGFSPADLDNPLLRLTNLLMWAVQRLSVPLWEFLYHDPLAAVRQQLGLPQAESQLALKRLLNRVRGTTTKKCESVVEVQMFNWLLEYPTTLKPNQVVVGPGTPRPAHLITPPVVASFVSNAMSGLVLVAVGSTYQSAALLSVEDVHALAAAFNMLAPVRVLMALSDSHLPEGLKVEDLELNDNVMTVPWVDYNDVLGHPNTRLIVSHGGVHSVYEAAYHGVPMVAMPFMYEAVGYVERYISRGAGLMCHQSPVFRRAKPHMIYTTAHVHDLIHQVLTDLKYTTAAQSISFAMKTYAKNRHPYERAADEIELAMYTHYAQHKRQAGSIGPVTDSSSSSSSSSKAVAIDSSSCMINQEAASATGGSGAVAVDSSTCFDIEQ